MTPSLAKPPATPGTGTGSGKAAFPQISVSFSEAWWLERYGEAASRKNRSRLLWERFGNVGLGEENPPSPEAAAPSVGGEYGDRFMAALWGCEIVYEPGRAPAALSLPEPRRCMEQLRSPDLDASPVIKKTIEKAEDLKRRHGRCQACINFGGPLNNAVSVFGEEILAVCAEAPDLARQVLQMMGEAILAVHDRVVCRINGVEPAVSRRDGWGIGNCPVCMIAPETYAEVVLPVDKWMRDQFAGGFGLHHCGVFDRYAEVYRPLRPTSLDLGPGSDLRIARRAYPEAVISAYLDVAKVSGMNRDEIDAVISRMVAAAGHGECFPKISVADVGPDMPDETVRWLMTAPTRLVA